MTKAGSGKESKLIKVRGKRPFEWRGMSALCRLVILFVWVWHRCKSCQKLNCLHFSMYQMILYIVTTASKIITSQTSFLFGYTLQLPKNAPGLGLFPHDASVSTQQSLPRSSRLHNATSPKLAYTLSLEAASSKQRLQFLQRTTIQPGNTPTLVCLPYHLHQHGTSPSTRGSIHHHDCVTTTVMNEYSS